MCKCVCNIYIYNVCVCVSFLTYAGREELLSYIIIHLIFLKYLVFSEIHSGDVPLFVGISNKSIFISLPGY